MDFLFCRAQSCPSSLEVGLRPHCFPLGAPTRLSPASPVHGALAGEDFTGSQGPLWSFVLIEVLSEYSLGRGPHPCNEEIQQHTRLKNQEVPSSPTVTVCTGCLPFIVTSGVEAPSSPCVGEKEKSKTWKEVTGLSPGLEVARGSSGPPRWVFRQTAVLAPRRCGACPGWPSRFQPQCRGLALPAPVPSALECSVDFKKNRKKEKELRHRNECLLSALHFFLIF